MGFRHSPKPMPNSTQTADSGTRIAIYSALVGVVALGVIGVVFSPSNAITIIGFCGVVVTGLFTHLSTLNTAEQTREQVADVKTALVEKDEKQGVQLDGISKMGERNHVLLNNNMSIQLKSNAELSRWKANQTKDPRDIKAADEAEQLYHEHQGKQMKLDAQDAKDARDAKGNQ